MRGIIKGLGIGLDFITCRAFPSLAKNSKDRIEKYNVMGWSGANFFGGLPLFNFVVSSARNEKGQEVLEKYRERSIKYLTPSEQEEIIHAKRHIVR